MEGIAVTGLIILGLMFIGMMGAWAFGIVKE